MLALLLDAAALAAVAVVWAVVLVDAGMLLEPLQRWAREAYAAKYSDECRAYYAELDSQWWAKALWLCFWCVAGQLAFWTYLLGHLHRYDGRFVFVGYSFLDHATLVAFTILLAGAWNAFYQWTKRNS